MPTYVFRCASGHEFETIQSSTEPNPICVIEQCSVSPEPSETVKVPSFRGHVQGDTPKFYPNRR